MNTTLTPVALRLNEGNGELHASACRYEESSWCREQGESQVPGAKGGVVSGQTSVDSSEHEAGSRREESAWLNRS
jgi:hypothetical protein